MSLSLFPAAESEAARDGGREVGAAGDGGREAKAEHDGGRVAWVALGVASEAFSKEWRLAKKNDDLNRTESFGIGEGCCKKRISIYVVEVISGRREYCFNDI